jgi:hypothetical protein
MRPTSILRGATAALIVTLVTLSSASADHRGGHGPLYRGSVPGMHAGAYRHSREMRPPMHGGMHHRQDYGHRHHPGHHAHHGYRQPRQRFCGGRSSRLRAFTGRTSTADIGFIAGTATDAATASRASPDPPIIPTAMA